MIDEKKLIERLEEVSYNHFDLKLSEAISIVNQLAAEYNNESVKGELISRQTVLEVLEESFNNYAVPWCKNAFSIKIKNEIIKIPTACNDGWIPVSSGKLPESGMSVIVTYKDRFLTQADGTCEGWYDATNMMWNLIDYEYSDNVEVIAWKERLAPYQPKGE